MKYLKRTHLDRKTITGFKSFYITQGGEAVLDSRYNLLLPRGTTDDQSPDDSTAPTFINGMIRYNTETAEFEGYQGGSGSGGGSWRAFRFKEPGDVQIQNIGTGNASEVYFGPLVPDPFSYPAAQSGTTWNVTQMAKNILVIVENVLQIANVNYNLVQNPPGRSSGTWVQFGTAVPNSKPVYVISGFDR